MTNTGKRWVVHRGGVSSTCTCPECGENFFYMNRGQFQIEFADYCPRCGASMNLEKSKESTAAEIQEAGRKEADDRMREIHRITGHWLAYFICPVCGEHSRKPDRECPFCHTIMIETEDQAHG